MPDPISAEVAEEAKDQEEEVFQTEIIVRRKKKGGRQTKMN